MKGKDVSGKPTSNNTNSNRRIARFGGKPRPPEALIPLEAIPEPPPPTPDRVRATPKAKKGQK